MCSREKANFDKSITFYSSNTIQAAKDEIFDFLGIRESHSMKKYLSFPTLVGRGKKTSFQYIKDRINRHIDNWSTRTLSLSEKEIFIKAILQAVLTYAMSCFLLLRAFCSEIKSIFTKYMWQKSKGKREIHWCFWDKLCNLKEESGLNFKDMRKFNIAMLAK